MGPPRGTDETPGAQTKPTLSVMGSIKIPCTPASVKACMERPSSTPPFFLYPGRATPLWPLRAPMRSRPEGNSCGVWFEAPPDVKVIAEAQGRWAPSFRDHGRRETSSPRARLSELT
jgi:hypothetical protein